MDDKGYLDTGDIRNRIIEMLDDGLVLVGTINCEGHDLRYVKMAYHAKIEGKEVLILEMENFVPYVDGEPYEIEREDIDDAGKRTDSTTTS